MSNRPNVSKVRVRTNTNSMTAPSTDVTLETEDMVQETGFTVTLTGQGSGTATVTLEGDPTVSNNGAMTALSYPPMSNDPLFPSNPSTVNVTLTDKEGQTTNHDVEVIYE